MAKSKREFGEGTIYTITDYVLWLFLGNLYFILLNIPLVFIMILLLSNGTNPFSREFLPVIIICSIPVGPAATALLSVMGKLIRVKDVDITKDFLGLIKQTFFNHYFFGL